MSKPSISIVMAYYNRQVLLNRTIDSIKKSSVKDYELIIVDDGSTIPLECKEAKIIRIEPEDKWWHNPCIPFNIGFKEATGDIVVIQNPECLHMGDILKHVQETVKDGIYVAYPCYAINEEQTMRIGYGIQPEIEDKRFSGKSKNGWYNHRTFRPVAYHFCSAITKKDLDVVGGFDEEYAKGISYDDDDFIYSIYNKGIQIQTAEGLFVIHQYHPPYTYQRDGWRELHDKNKKLFNKKWM